MTWRRAAASSGCACVRVAPLPRQEPRLHVLKLRFRPRLPLNRHAPFPSPAPSLSAVPPALRPAARLRQHQRRARQRTRRRRPGVEKDPQSPPERGTRNPSRSAALSSRVFHPCSRDRTQTFTRMSETDRTHSKRQSSSKRSTAYPAESTIRATVSLATLRANAGRGGPLLSNLASRPPRAIVRLPLFSVSSLFVHFVLR